MQAGRSPQEALDALVDEDELRDVRQVAFVDRQGRAAAHTGAGCIPHCGDRQGHGVSVQGNMLRSDEVWPAMLEAFDAATGSLADRLLDALDAAESAGGDFRGRQAAGLVVVTSDEAPSQSASSTCAWTTIHSRSPSFVASTAWRPATDGATGSRPA